MISAPEALYLILQNQQDFGTETVSLLQSARRILAQPVFADRDFPPFNRVMMDGIAINSAAFEKGIRTFTIEKIQAAGSPQLTLNDLNNCIEIMTGAVLPANTDAVISYEQCEITAGTRHCEVRSNPPSQVTTHAQSEITESTATVKVDQVSAMQSVHIQASDSKKGELLAQKWQRITPAIIGIMASVGLSAVEVLRLPKITICSTGDELVDVTEQPESHQVRRSNVYMLAAALLAEGIDAATVHLPDNPEKMTAAIGALVKQNDVLLFSGAVSKGKFDYLPQVLEQLGMQLVFHTIAQRPGKPFLFGKFADGPLVFGFPGNPVSTFVCYHQFFKKWLHHSMHYQAPKHFARLAADINFKPSLTYHLLVQVQNHNGSMFATPVTNSGSGDLVTLTKAEGIIMLPAEKDFFKEGEVHEVNLLS